MEQRIGSNSQPPGAGFDPAFVPGLTSPAAAEPEDAVSGTAAEDAAADDGAVGETSPKAAESGESDVEETASDATDDEDDAVDADRTDDEETAEAGPRKAAADGSAEDTDADDEAEGEGDRAGADAEDAADPDGPVFEASDRRASITADHRGVRLRLDDQEAEFRWDEIGAVETESPRFGKRFTVTVHTPDRRWYPIEIEATARSRFKEWESRLDEVLDAYFEDGEDAEGDAA
ncbi:hypothetical protein BKI49_23455 [Streptomyces sp. Tue6028]|uniref:hypothetical protein n=1 Tax=Streptomyces sp. Tue6028 TaxID=2036037 RepID=UPI000BB390BD|nr:hypothetical protein [Streptomyces sp. Tue6028]PBC61550.1 hypothetical protein BKI49_23455 [Streptomyces sp. Tue6028]